MSYFNAYGKIKKKNQGWQNFCGFEPIPDGHGDPAYKASVLTVDNKLLVAGGYRYRKSYCADDRSRMLKWNHSGVYHGNVAESGMQFGDNDGVLSINMSNPWSEVRSMNDTRHSFPMIQLGKFVYAIGT